MDDRRTSRVRVNTPHRMDLCHRPCVRKMMRMGTRVGMLITLAATLVTLTLQWATQRKPMTSLGIPQSIVNGTWDERRGE